MFITEEEWAKLSNVEVIELMKEFNKTEKRFGTKNNRFYIGDTISVPMSWIERDGYKYHLTPSCFLTKEERAMYYGGKEY